MVTTNAIKTSVDAVVRDYAFPDVHIGGDESNGKQWQANPEEAGNGRFVQVSEVWLVRVP